VTDSASEPTIRVGEIDVRVTDPNSVIPVSCEFITDLRVIDGVLFLSLASHVVDGNGPPEARVVARLRIPLATLSGIQNGVTNVLAEIEKSRKAAN